MIRANKLHRKNERGVTIVLVAFSLAVLLGMAALAIDVSMLYVAHGEAQRAADADALAGAKMFASSGYTSAPTSLPAADVCQTGGPGATAAANRLAEAVAAQNLIAGQPARQYRTSRAMLPLRIRKLRLRYGGPACPPSSDGFLGARPTA